MTSLITLNTHLSGVACLRRGHLIASVRGAGLKVIAMRSVGLGYCREISACAISAREKRLNLLKTLAL
jgi:hypothetical protein